MLTRRDLIALSAALAFAPNPLIPKGRAQTAKADYPNKPVRFIVPVAAGGPTDIVARMLAEKLSKMWGQQVFIENKGGAGTNIGNEYAARVRSRRIHGLVRHLVPCGEHQPLSLAELRSDCGFCAGLACHPACLFRVRAELLAGPFDGGVHRLCQSPNPGKLTMASPGTGSAPFLAEMVFLQMADIQMTHVPYRGASPAFADLIPGRVDCYFGSGALLSYARSGQVRVLATTGAKRDVAAPDVPTIAEAGVPGYDVTAWQALFVPTKTPPEIVRKISADTKTALTDPAIKDKLTRDGLRGWRLFARGAWTSAQVGNRQMERRHQVSRHQNRIIFRACSPSNSSHHADPNFPRLPAARHRQQHLQRQPGAGAGRIGP